MSPSSRPLPDATAELARTSAAIRPCSGWDSLVVSGAERSSWLEGLVTCQVGQLQPGQGTWGLSLNRQGKIQSEVWVAAAADRLWLGLAPGTLDGVEPELQRRLIMEDAELLRPEPAQRWFALHGPEAPERAQALAQEFEGRAARVDWSGLGGAALVVPEAHAPALESANRSLLLSDDAWLRLRLERGLPEFGTDFDGRDRPHEAALERRAVNWTKGCYLGQEVVCMQDMRGKVKRSLRLLRVDAPEHAGPLAGAELVDAAKQTLGSLTSSAYSPRAGAWLALARVELEPLARAEGIACGPAGDPRWPAQLAEPV